MSSHGPWGLLSKALAVKRLFLSSLFLLLASYPCIHLSVGYDNAQSRKPGRALGTALSVCMCLISQFSSQWLEADIIIACILPMKLLRQNQIPLVDGGDGTWTQSNLALGYGLKTSTIMILRLDTLGATWASSMPRSTPPLWTSESIIPWGQESFVPFCCCVTGV
jgi:hypothetical protein